MISDEWGYFSLKELEGLNVNGLTVEQDLFFKPGKFKDVIARFWKGAFTKLKKEAM